MADNYIRKQTEKGSINISEDVISVMVSAAAEEVDGVAGLSNSPGSDIAEFIGLKTSQKGVRVQFKDDVIIIDVLMILRYGCNVASVAQKAQKNIACAVESMTGMSTQVNVHISGIAFNK